MSQPRDDRQDDLFCPALEEIINLRHPMVRLAAAIDWGSWRDGEQIAALLQESLSVAHRTGAIESKDLERVVVDTTVQEKAIAHPTDARRMRRNYLKGRDGDRINAVLAAAGYNFSLLLR